jgi:nucleotide-binding universal stress UspA family protein
MTKWTLPEGRKPLTDADIAALTRRLADTAIDYKELYQAAKRDAEEAEAYAKELEAKLAKAVEALEELLEMASLSPNEIDPIPVLNSAHATFVEITKEQSDEEDRG